jgi:DNA-binding FadR family transcriptional regulator
MTTATRPEQAAEVITALARGAEPGHRLGTKDELRARCAVSVGTFNEALRLVQARGVVTVRPGPGGGLFVSRQSLQVRLGNSMLALDEDATSVADAVRLRDALDPLLVQDALRHAADGDIAAMRDELARMQIAAEGPDPTAFVQSNWALHARIADVTPNALLRAFYMSLLDTIESHTLSVLPDEEHPLPEFIRSRYQLHAELVQAIADRDDARALALVHEHNTTMSHPG